ncbi:MAG: hypothetical protein LQ352_003720 [Teloschistes flavicans]|nr:MAG: hypothetical protein LQ352_003720 [Teloschistes flavicans]
MAFRLAHRVLHTEHPRPTPILYLRRAIHLVHSIYAPTQSGRLAGLEWKRLADPSGSELHLRIKGIKAISPITLSHAIARLHPGSYLARLQPLDSVDSIPERSYEVSQLTGLRPKPVLNSGPPKIINFKRAGRGKELHMTSALDLLGYAFVLRLAYNHLIDGARLEMHFRLTKGELRDQKDFDHVLFMHPHLRPEPILQGMPEETIMLHEPLYDKKGNQLIWVMANDNNWRGNRSTGWTGKARTPPRPEAIKTLSELPIIEAPSQSVPAHPVSHKEP